MTAGKARAVRIHTDPMGFGVLIPRKINSKEITRTYLAPRVTGWRQYLTAKASHRSAVASGAIAAR